MKMDQNGLNLIMKMDKRNYLYIMKTDLNHLKLIMKMDKRN